MVHWNALFSEEMRKITDSMPPQKFQNASSMDDNIGGKDGYSLQAIHHYDQYYDSVERTRRNSNKEVLEHELMKMMEALDGGKKYHNKTSKRKWDGELNYVDENGSPIVVRCAH